MLVARVRKCYYLIILAAILMFVGWWVFSSATISPQFVLPRGPIYIGAGADKFLNISRTEVAFYEDSYNSYISFLVRFGKSNSTFFFMYVILPFTVDPHYNPGHFSSDLQPGHDVLLQNFNETSSVANVTGQLKTAIDGEVSLGLGLRSNSPLISTTAPLGSKKSLLITFFGDITGTWDNRMGSYVAGPNSQLVISKPVIIYIALPPNTFVSPDTFPRPISQYMVSIQGEERRSAVFSLNFLGGNVAQTISCTFIDPELEQQRQIYIYLGGLLLATGVSLAVNVFNEALRRKLSYTKIE